MGRGRFKGAVPLKTVFVSVKWLLAWLIDRGVTSVCHSTSYCDAPGVAVMRGVDKRDRDTPLSVTRPHVITGSPPSGYYQDLHRVTSDVRPM